MIQCPHFRVDFTFPAKLRAAEMGAPRPDGPGRGHGKGGEEEGTVTVKFMPAGIRIGRVYRSPTPAIHAR